MINDEFGRNFFVVFNYTNIISTILKLIYRQFCGIIID